MPDTGTTKWRGFPVAPGPDDYRLEVLVPLARKARNRIVEFEWFIGPEDLGSFRDGVYANGRSDVGRYRSFNARLLRVVNDALGELRSACVLTEPGSSRSLECAVSCERVGDCFRVWGHAPFDVILGYARAGLREDKWASYISPDAGGVLVSAIEPLGWDLNRLQQFPQVWNAFYGLKLDHRLPGSDQPDPGPAVEVTVHFDGPFSAFDGLECPCLFTHAMSRKRGVYLWMTCPVIFGPAEA